MKLAFKRVQLRPGTWWHGGKVTFHVEAAGMSFTVSHGPGIISQQLRSQLRRLIHSSLPTLPPITHKG